jgi:hypothetical protein
VQGHPSAPKPRDAVSRAHDLAAAVRAHPAVAECTPTGPQPFGWEFRLGAEDFAAVAAALPALVRPHDPLAGQWDRLGRHARYRVILSGPATVDLAFPDIPRSPGRPWRIGPDTLAAVDVHFWDWTLWLLGKLHEGKSDRVMGELLTMSGHLLQPLGIRTLPTNLPDATERYLRARTRLEERYGIQVPRRLESEIRPLLRTPSGLFR